MLRAVSSELVRVTCESVRFSSGQASSTWSRKQCPTLSRIVCSRASSSGYTLALEALKENARLQHELADHKAALQLAEQGEKGGMLEGALQAVLPVVAARMMASQDTPAPPPPPALP